jgi:hypothetical protein
VKLAARTFYALAVTTQLGFGCSTPQTPGAAGAVCTMDTDCSSGLVCLPPMGGPARCGNNLSAIAFTEDATAVTTDAPVADSPATDAGAAGDSTAPPVDAGGAEVGMPPMEASVVDEAASPDSSGGD